MSLCLFVSLFVCLFVTLFFSCQLRTFAPLHFAPLHLCTFVPLHLLHLCTYFATFQHCNFAMLQLCYFATFSVGGWLVKNEIKADSAHVSWSWGWAWQNFVLIKVCFQDMKMFKPEKVTISGVNFNICFIFLSSSDQDCSLSSKCDFTEQVTFPYCTCVQICRDQDNLVTTICL